ncbi:hypothetical protein [Streptomyces sp. NPDC026589]|uniref:hypothetical protein n=1 Tax=Streptomyces sp. NPDC026589 TaxID=3155609 RepID=UPI0033D94549
MRPFRGTSLPDSANESVQHLKRYLEYAENGPAVLARDVVQSDAEPDSPFEESVLAVLNGWGHTVQPQVGVAGYRIDLGLRHPRHPGAYALGIECDGAMYHSSKAARDRDRLREQVLNGLGWRLYRIWGTDWYRGACGSRTEAGETARKVTLIAPAERQLALRELAAECPGMSQDELIREACEFFGWRRTGADIRTALESDIADLYRRGRLQGGPDRISVVRGGTPSG